MIFADGNGPHGASTARYAKRKAPRTRSQVEGGKVSQRDVSNILIRALAVVAKMSQWTTDSQSRAAGLAPYGVRPSRATISPGRRAHIFL